MSSELEDIYGAMFEAKVPAAWSKLYPTLKPLAAWTRDLVRRIEAFEKVRFIDGEISYKDRSIDI